MIFAEISTNLPEEHFKRLKGEIGKGDSILQRINDVENNFPNSSIMHKKFFRKICDESFLKKLIISTPDILEYLKNNELKEFNDLFYDNATNPPKTKPFSEYVLGIFGYKNFRDNKNGNWFSKALNIKACPYCNSQYTLTTNSNILCEYDHFFPKDKYPYLCVSFYNLIPICSSCNRKKSDKEFSTKENYHPYFNDLHKIFSFSINFKRAIDFLIGGRNNIENIKIDLVLNKIYFGKAEEIIFENHKDNFPIEELYENHKDVVAELLLKSQIYNKKYKEQLLSLKISNNKIKGNLFSEEELNQLIVGNYIKEEDFLKRPLSKLTYDISKELRLI